MITFAASSKVSLAPAGVQNTQGIITGQFLKPIESGHLRAGSRSEGLCRRL